MGAFPRLARPLRRRIVIATSCLALAAGAAGAAGEDDPAPVEPRLAREERLAGQRRRLDATLAACEALGPIEPFGAALRRLQQEHGEFVDGKERWAPVARGWLPLMAVDHFVDWHLPGGPRDLPRALDFDHDGHPFHAIVDLARQLNDHGIDFVLVTFPSRLQLYPELVLPDLEGKLGEGFAGVVASHARFLRALNEAGVETLDLAPHFAAARAPVADDGGEIYLQRNKHWTPRASQLAARVAADHVRSLPWFEPGPVQEGKDYEVIERNSPFSSTAGGQAPDTTPEKLRLEQLRPLGGPPNPVHARNSPIVVLGDSFAKFYLEHSSSFADHLRRYTGHAIDAIWPMGGAELQCRQQLARRDDGMKGKKVVLWLLQEDNLKPGSQFKKVAIFGR